MTNIIVTVGPSSEHPEVLKKLKLAGANKFRVNLSHSSHQSVQEYFDLLHKHEITPAIDTQGAQLRIVQVSDNLPWNFNQNLLLIFGDEKSPKETKERFIRINHIEAFEQISKGDILKLDVEGLAIECGNSTSYGCYEAKVIAPGTAIINRAVDVLEKSLRLSVLTEFDKQIIDFALTNGCKEIYASFISCKEQILSVREITGSDIRLISKIETLRGVENIVDIVNLSDEVLVDRGDLSRETTIPFVPMATSRVIHVANQYNVPVNVATNVLDSMMRLSLPSRAEVSDIYSLLESGVSGIVLSAEVAIGKHPVQSTSFLRYLINVFEHHNYPERSALRPVKPAKELIGEELFNWL